jgi:hypothetical protein
MFLGQKLDNTLLTDSMIESLGLTLNPPAYVGPAKLILPPIANKFHSILAIDDNNTIINNSNSFLSDSNFVLNDLSGLNAYDIEHSILRRIYLTYKYLSETAEDIVIENEMFLLCNPFSAINIGHDLSILFERINIYREQKLEIPVVVSEFMLTIPRSLEVCKMLLPNTEFYILPNNKIVKFQKLHITRNETFNIKKHAHIIREIIEHVTTSIPNINDYKNRKILMIKTTRNKNVVTKLTCFTGENTIDHLTRQCGYVYINPEEMPMNKIIAYLFFGSKIVCSHGAILYAHAIFFNPDITYIFLNIDGVACNPYDDDSKKYRRVYAPRDLDTNLPKLLLDLGESDVKAKSMSILSILNTHK